MLLAAAAGYYLMMVRPEAVTAAATPVPVPAPAETTAAAPAAAAPSAETAFAAQPTPEAARLPAEAEEAALHLGTADRQRLQVALTALGFDTRGTDGAFGPRSREMIAAWQKARNHPETGYLTAAESQALLREAQPALQRFDEDKKKPVAPFRRQPSSASPPAPRTEFFP
jgi:peptidoglycan hydrolase-like protein with peptidoglycan-binding domain